MVATIPVREAKAATLPLEEARRFAEALPQLAAQGVSRISFTGGEPLLAPKQMQVLSAAAGAAGQEATVVTACHWATTETAAERVVARFPDIQSWHLSSDVHHSAFLDPMHVVHAARAVSAVGKTVILRMAVSRVPSVDEIELMRRMKAHLPSSVHVAIQPIASVGRARDLDLDVPIALDGQPPATPCVSTGPLIRHDGCLLPCCSALADAPETSPFANVNAIEHGLVTAYRAWCDDPLMQLVRATGFRVPAAWAEDALGTPPVTPAPENPCDYCAALWANTSAHKTALEQVARPAVRAKIRLLAQAVFDEDPTPKEV